MVSVITVVIKKAQACKRVWSFVIFECNYQGMISQHIIWTMSNILWRKVKNDGLMFGPNKRKLYCRTFPTFSWLSFKHTHTILEQLNIHSLVSHEQLEKTGQIDSIWDIQHERELVSFCSFFFFIRIQILYFAYFICTCFLFIHQPLTPWEYLFYQLW